MPKEHYYKNHREVISILTQRYGFTYQGIGNNSEECFYKDSDRPETIFVHPLFCSYYMACSREILAKRIHVLNVESDSKQEQEQTIAFQKLLLHLDKVALEEGIPPFRGSIEYYLGLLEEMKVELKEMAANTTTISTESKKLIPRIYENITLCQSLLDKVKSL